LPFDAESPLKNLPSYSSDTWQLREHSSLILVKGRSPLSPSRTEAQSLGQVWLASPPFPLGSWRFPHCSPTCPISCLAVAATLLGSLQAVYVCVCHVYT
jgi:hypothetical protein